MQNRRTNPYKLMAAPMVSVLVTLAGLAVPLSAQALTIDIQSGMASSRVQGSGKVIEDKRTLGSFTRLRLDGAITVNARPAGASGVTVQADDNIAPLILTNIEGDTLVVKLKPNTGIRTASPVVVSVDFTRLTKADLRGSGDLNITSLKGEQFELSLAGSGDVRLGNAELGKLAVRLAGSGDIWVKGKCEDASYNIAGSGDVHAAELQATRVKVDIAGSGDARVHASEALSVQIAGSGDVSYSGNPAKVNSRVVGSGDLRRVR
ncbi:head GIN domain-containing protein [Chitinimonas sp. PSY-7]|uniref:GIN domain-containing protein n=1 Tax=Chitinimonas sp. PSY-7 TaxID=3459088 RepID=UPI0040402A48